jgi:hypothetical protein
VFPVSRRCNCIGRDQRVDGLAVVEIALVILRDLQIDGQRRGIGNIVWSIDARADEFTP